VGGAGGAQWTSVRTEEGVGGLTRGAAVAEIMRETVDEERRMERREGTGMMTGVEEEVGWSLSGVGIDMDLVVTEEGK